MKQVTIYTDGGCKGNPGPGGYGAVMLYGQHRKELYQGYSLTTNNRMEIMAAIVALETLKEACQVTLYSDSKYLVDSVSKGWLTNWQKKGWLRSGREPVVNIDLWKRLLPLLSKHQIDWQWVKGHSGVPENECADQLCGEALEHPLLEDEYYLNPLQPHESYPR